MSEVFTTWLGTLASTLGASLQATSALEFVSVAFGLAYVVLAARENVWCWPAAVINTGTAIALFWDATLLMESGLNVFYLLIAFYGWWQWQYGGDDESPLKIRRWPLRNHLMTLVVALGLTSVSGHWLAGNSSASFPYLDSFTTWAAVLCTWMVTRKVLENWLYWIVINSISIYLFYSKGLALYSLLMALYLVIAVYGYRQWLSSFTLTTSAAGTNHNKQLETGADVIDNGEPSQSS